MTHNHSDLVENINNIIEDFSTIMLASLNSSNSVHSRPMSIAKHNTENGDIYFTTSVDAGKTDEITQDPRVNVTMQSKNQFVSLSGTAKVINDRALIKELYEESWRAWFPGGPEQEDIRLIHFNPNQGEYWDLSGMNSLKFLWQAGKAIAKDQEVDTDNPDIHAKVNL